MRSSLAEEVLVEDDGPKDEGPKPLEPEILPLPSAPVSSVNDGDPDSDGNQPDLK